jgi:hypothetical protein
MRTIPACAALVSAALLLVLSGTAAAEDACREDCRHRFARCRVDARVSLRECRETCAADDARCLARCRVAHRARVAACEDRRLHCTVRCRDDVDPACAADCFEDHLDCRHEQRDCASDCAEELRNAVADCYEREDDLRACLTAAREAGRLCVDACREDHPCRRETRACLAECVVQE